MLDTLARDLRFARRSLARTPAVTAGAIFSITLGVAATTAVFSVVDAAILRPPPFHDVGRLATLYIARQDPGAAPARERWSWIRSLLLQSATSFDHIARYSTAVLALTGDEPEPVDAEFVSSSYWPTLGIRLERGRAFGPDQDEAAGEHAVAVMGYEIWQRRYAGDPALVGRTIQVNGVTLIVVGVAPRGFRGLSGRAQLWMPATIAPRVSYAGYLTTNQNFISVVGHLAAGATFETARAELAVLGSSIQRRAPTSSENPQSRFSATLVPLSDARIDPSTERPLRVLLGAVACLLILSCANVAGLLVGRAVSRRREIAIRVATGASRARIIGQLLAEASLLSLAGGVLGVLAAIPISARLMLPSAPARGRNFYGALSEFTEPRVDVRVLVFCVGLCALTAVAFGLFPALRASRVDLVTDLKDGAGGASHESSRLNGRQAIIAVEAALAVILLFCSGLLATSWRRLARTNVGFEPSRLLTFMVRPSDVQYPPPKAAILVVRLLDQIARVPGVVAASVDGCAPVGTGCASSTLYVVGRPVPAPDAAPAVLRHYVAPDHFRTLGVQLLRGRAFNSSDRAGSNRVALINQTAARRFWPNEDPIGQRVWFGGGSSFDRPDSSAEIVGIVADVAYQHLDEHPFQADFYTPFSQFTYAARTVLVRTQENPAVLVPELRRAVHAVEPNLALFDVKPMNQLLDESWARVGYETRLLGAFSLAAMALAAMGIFAVVAHAIGDRRREIGVRMALGATPAQVIRTVGDRGARPAFVGLAVGFGIALVVGRILAASTYGVRGFEPGVAALVLASAASVIVFASYAAACRALAVGVGEALRT